MKKYNNETTKDKNKLNNIFKNILWENNSL